MLASTDKAEKNARLAGLIDRGPLSTFASFLRHKFGEEHFRPILRAVMFTEISKEKQLLSLEEMRKSQFEVFLTRAETEADAEAEKRAREGEPKDTCPLNRVYLHRGPELLEEYRRKASGVLISHHLSKNQNIDALLYIRMAVAQGESVETPDDFDRRFFSKSLDISMGFTIAYLHNAVSEPLKLIYCSLMTQLLHVASTSFGMDVTHKKKDLQHCPSASAFNSNENKMIIRRAFNEDRELQGVQESLVYLDTLRMDNLFFENTRVEGHLSAAYRGYCKNQYIIAIKTNPGE